MTSLSFNQVQNRITDLHDGLCWILRNVNSHVLNMLHFAFQVYVVLLHLEIFGLDTATVFLFHIVCFFLGSSINLYFKIFVKPLFFIKICPNTTYENLQSLPLSLKLLHSHTRSFLLHLESLYALLNSLLEFAFIKQIFHLKVNFRFGSVFRMDL